MSNIYSQWRATLAGHQKTRQQNYNLYESREDNPQGNKWLGQSAGSRLGVLIYESRLRLFEKISIHIHIFLLPPTESENASFIVFRIRFQHCSALRFSVLLYRVFSSVGRAIVSHVAGSSIAGVIGRHHLDMTTVTTAKWLTLCFDSQDADLTFANIIHINVWAFIASADFNIIQFIFAARGRILHIATCVEYNNISIKTFSE